MKSSYTIEITRRKGNHDTTLLRRLQNMISALQKPATSTHILETESGAVLASTRETTFPTTIELKKLKLGEKNSFNRYCNYFYDEDPLSYYARDTLREFSMWTIHSKDASLPKVVFEGSQLWNEKSIFTNSPLVEEMIKEAKQANSVEKKLEFKKKLKK